MRKVSKTNRILSLVLCICMVLSLIPAVPSVVSAAENVDSTNAVASVTIGQSVSYYTTLNKAVQAVANCTADDKAVVTILKDIALYGAYQQIAGGVFTIDLNGYMIAYYENDHYGALVLFDGADVTIQDSGEGGVIAGYNKGIDMRDCTLTILGGTISGGDTGLYANNGTVLISGGIVIGGSVAGVTAEYNSVLTISGGTFSGKYGVRAYRSTVTISGGTICGDTYDLYERDSDANDFTLTHGENGVGATFPGGINVGTAALLNAILGDDVFYWQGVQKITPTDDATEISGGDVVIKTCEHSWLDASCTEPKTCSVCGTTEGNVVHIWLDASCTEPKTCSVCGRTEGEALGHSWLDATCTTPKTCSVCGETEGELDADDHTPVADSYTDNGDGTHSFTCSGCGTVTEDHSYTDHLCSCGMVSPDAVASVTIGQSVIYYATLNDAVQAVANCTADDKAVVTILKDIALGEKIQTISAGVFTMDLNGCEISSTAARDGALFIWDGADVTIQDSGEDGKITGFYDAIEMHQSTLTILGGTISGGETGLYAANGTVLISGGTFIGTNTEGACIDHSGTMTITGGTFGGKYGVGAYGSTVTISGGTICGDTYDFCDYGDADFTLTYGENGVGATFPGGIQLGEPIQIINLGEGAFYWQGDNIIIPTNKMNEISGGDVVIKTCEHSWLDASCTEPKTCSVCSTTEGEALGHSWLDASCTEPKTCSVCGTTEGGVDTNNHVSTVSYVNGFCPNGCYEPAKLVGEYYQIENGGQLYWFAAYVNAGNLGANAKLMNHIVVNENVLTKDGSLNEGTFRVWTPIGTSSNQYSGTFDGQDYTVSGLYFDDSTANHIGLFGSINKDGLVKNVGVINSYIRGKERVGAVAGQIYGGTMINCYNAGIVNGVLFVGGVNGINVGGTITDCYNTGSVNGSGKSYNVGGVVGYNSNSTSVVRRCYNTGSVTLVTETSGNYTGGVVGHNYGTVEECWNSGSVTVTNADNVGNAYVGGVVGYNGKTLKNSYNTGTISATGGSNLCTGGVVGMNPGGTIENCYSIGKISSTGVNVGGIVGAHEIFTANGTRDAHLINCYYDSTVYSGKAIGLNDNGKVDALTTGKTTAQFASGEVCYLLNGNQSNIVYYQTCGEGQPAFSGKQVYYGYASCANNAQMVYTNIEANKTKPNHSWLDATCTAPKTCSFCGKTEGDAVDHPSYTNGFCTVCDGYEPATGSGTESDPYKIGNAGQLYWFAAKVNGGKSSVWAELTADIVVNENVLNADGTLNEGTYRAWTPMGDIGHKYTGTFDGKGYTVSGLYFNDSAANDVGLFGYVMGGTVQNVGVVDCYLSGGKYVGGVVGENYNNSTVTNCYNTGTVSGSSNYVGGVVGYNYNNSTVTNCHNTGTVSDGDSVGGVVGENYNNSTVTNCYNTGTVSGGSRVGGVVGYNDNSTVTNCYNSGTVSGYWYVGGVVGENQKSTVTNCYNTGTVSGSDYVGGVVGENYDNSTVTNCHNTGTVSDGDSVGGVVGKNLKSTVTNCYNTGTVSGSDYVGGVVGYNYNSTVTNCYNTGTVSGGSRVGGVVGYNFNSTVTNCYNSDTVSGNNYVGGVVGENYNNSTVTNCYNTGTVSISGWVGGVVGCNEDSTVTNCYYDSTVCSADAIGYNGGGTVSDVMSKTTEQFASGEVAYLLSQGCTVGEGEDAVTYPGDIWGQNIDGEGEKDAYPVFSDAKVYQILNCNNEPAGYSNTESDALGHDWTDADCDTPKTCTGCGTTEGDALGHDWDGNVCVRCNVAAQARIADTYFINFTDAVAAAKEGDIIQVLTDVAIDEELTFAGFVTLQVADGVRITPDKTMVKIGTDEGMIFDNKLYFYKETDERGISIADVTKPTYYKAGDGYAIYLPATDSTEAILELHNATITTRDQELNGSSNSSKAIEWNGDLTLRFFGTNTIAAGQSPAENCGIIVGGNLTLEGSEDAVLYVSSGKCPPTSIGIQTNNLIITGGTVYALAAESDCQSMAVSAVTVTVAEGAALYAAGGITPDLSIGVAAMNVSGNINALVLTMTLISDDEVVWDVIAMGDAQLTANTQLVYHAKDIGYEPKITFTVPENAVLTVNEGVTLNLVEPALESIDFSGTVVNNGTILLPADFRLEDAPKGGNVSIGEKSFTWNGHMWICTGDNHSWLDATCTDPKSCKYCSATEGDALGHDWTDADCDTPKTCKICGTTEGDALGHDWTDADCDTPKTCKICGTTEGEALGHSWNDATCTDPKTCSACGETEGEALGHDWKDADGDTIKTCTVCGITECDVLGHSYSTQWSYNHTSHWRECPCGERADYQNHESENCRCGFVEADVYVGGVGMADGQYLSNTGAISTDLPSGGYAFYQNGVLTLHDYVYTGTGYAHRGTRTAAIYSGGDLEIVLEGTNSLTNTFGSENAIGNGILCSDLTIRGTGALNIETMSECINAQGDVSISDCTISIQSANSDGLHAYYDEETGNLTIDSATVNITAGGTGIFASENVTISDSTITMDASKDGIWAGNDVTINGSNVTITCDASSTEDGGAIVGKVISVVDSTLNATCNGEASCILSFDYLDQDDHYVSITNSNVSIHGGMVGILSYTEIIITGGKLTVADTGMAAMASLGGITLNQVSITQPVGGSIGSFQGMYITLEADGETFATGVVIDNPCDHSNASDDSDCTTPVICPDCGTMITAAKEHSWTDATCTDPKTCSACGQTEGEPLGHSYTAAYSWDHAVDTCTATGTCSVCGDVQTETVQYTITVVDEAYCYMPRKLQYDADFTSHWAEDQTARYGDSDGPLDPNRHGSGYRYVNNGDGTHDVCCYFCGALYVENVSHRIEANIILFWEGHCMAQGYIVYKCPDCGGRDTVYTDVNSDIHAAGIASKPVDNGDGTHTMYYPCCNTPSDEILEHTFVDGFCACGAQVCEHEDADNSGRCDVCGVLMQPAKPIMISVSMKGNIGVNYYMLLSDEVLADATAYMQFTLADGEIRKVPVSEGVKRVYDSETYYVFTCNVDAKEMTDDILCQFFYDGGSTQEYRYSVHTYANHILSSDYDEASKNLIKAMVNYGAASQIHFGYNTDKLANAELETPDYSGVTIQGFNAVSGQGTDLAKFYSASLILKSETTLRFFFTAPITAIYNGQELEVKERSGLYYVDVVGISAKDLDENVTITINDGTNTADVTFNPMTYCQIVQNDTTGTFDQGMKDLVSALYLYNQAANVYFKEN